jgi:hypothetical protein
LKGNRDLKRYTERGKEIQILNESKANNFDLGLVLDPTSGQPSVQFQSSIPDMSFHDKGAGLLVEPDPCHPAIPDRFSLTMPHMSFDDNQTGFPWEPGPVQQNQNSPDILDHSALMGVMSGTISPMLSDLPQTMSQRRHGQLQSETTAFNGYPPPQGGLLVTRSTTSRLNMNSMYAGPVYFPHADVSSIQILSSPGLFDHSSALFMETPVGAGPGTTLDTSISDPTQSYIDSAALEREYNELCNSVEEFGLDHVNVQDWMNLIDPCYEFLISKIDYFRTQVEMAGNPALLDKPDELDDLALQYKRDLQKRADAEHQDPVFSGVNLTKHFELVELQNNQNDDDTLINQESGESSQSRECSEIVVELDSMNRIMPMNLSVQQQNVDAEETIRPNAPPPPAPILHPSGDVGLGQGDGDPLEPDQAAHEDQVDSRTDDEFLADLIDEYALNPATQGNKHLAEIVQNLFSELKANAVVQLDSMNRVMPINLSKQHHYYNADQTGKNFRHSSAAPVVDTSSDPGQDQEEINHDDSNQGDDHDLSNGASENQILNEMVNWYASNPATQGDKSFTEITRNVVSELKVNAKNNELLFPDMFMSCNLDSKKVISLEDEFIQTNQTQSTMAVGCRQRLLKAEGLIGTLNENLEQCNQKVDILNTNIMRVNADFNTFETNCWNLMKDTDAEAEQILFIALEQGLFEASQIRSVSTDESKIDGTDVLMLTEKVRDWIPWRQRFYSGVHHAYEVHMVPVKHPPLLGPSTDLHGY